MHGFKRKRIVEFSNKGSDPTHWFHFFLRFFLLQIWVSFGLAWFRCIPRWVVVVLKATWVFILVQTLRLGLCFDLDPSWTKIKINLKKAFFRTLKLWQLMSRLSFHGLLFTTQPYQNIMNTLNTPIRPLWPFLWLIVLFLTFFQRAVRVQMIAKFLVLCCLVLTNIRGREEWSWLGILRCHFLSFHPIIMIFHTLE